MKKLCKWLPALLLCALLTVPMGSREVQAAVKLSKSSSTVAVKEKLTLKVTGTKAKVTWSSSNPSVASVSNGKVTAKKEGNAVITAKAGKKKLTCKITVKGDYRKLYKAFLEKGKTVYKSGKNQYEIKLKGFYVLDIDKNGVPDLIVTDNEFFYNKCVYTVRSGKLVFCGWYGGRGDYGLNYSSKWKALYNFWWTNGIGGSGTQLMRLSGGKLKDYKYLWSGMNGMGSNAKPIYEHSASADNHKRVSKSTYNAAYKKYVQNQYKRYSFYSNTASMRNQKFGS